MAEISEVINELECVCEDTSVSKNIRATLMKIKSILSEQNGKEMDVKIDTAMQLVDDISSDPNISQFTRTQIWNITSLLEEAR